MTVLLHTPFFHPLVGGVETFTDGLAGELTKLGFAVTVYAETPLGTATELDRPYRLRRTGREHALDGMESLIAVGPSARLLGPARRRNIPTVLVHQNPIADCPIGIGWRDGQSCSYRLGKCLGCDVSGQSVLSNVKALARRAVVRRHMTRAANVYISDAIAARAGLPGQVIPNFYDPTVFHPDPAIPVESHVLFVGRLVPIKGADVAVRAVAAARRGGLSVGLRIVGDGPDRGKLTALAAAEGVAEAVTFVGAKQGPALADEYRRAWAVLFPSQWAEPFGIVMAEAMGCGTPVIASAHGACPEVVGGGGECVPAADVPAWADAVRRLADSPARRRALAAAAVARAGERFTLPAVAARYAALLRRGRA